MLRQPLLLLLLLGVAAFGAFRAIKYGNGRQRLWSTVPVGFLVFGGLVAPFVLGFLRGSGSTASFAGFDVSELLVGSVIVSLLLASVAGAILIKAFGPTR